MNNPMELIKLITNPQQYVMDIAKNNTNPLLPQLIEMAKKNDMQGLENFARNMFKQQGQDFDQIKSMFKN